MRESQKLQQQTRETHGSQGWLQGGSLPEKAAHVEKNVHVIAVQESRPEQPRPLPLLRQGRADWTEAFA